MEIRPMSSVQGNYSTLVGKRSYQFGNHCWS